MTEQAVFLGKSENPEYLNLKYANRHGLIAGATGGGKTVTRRIVDKHRFEEEEYSCEREERSRRLMTAQWPSRRTNSKATFETAARTLARELVRGVLGSLKRR